jgi:hypothetical protein
MIMDKHFGLHSIPNTLPCVVSKRIPAQASLP